MRGVTLIELITFIVIVSVAVAGVLGALNYAARSSVDPMTRKQALSIAEALLEEVALQPFTYCDPTDANVRTATSAAGCATLVEGMGPEAGEARTSAVTPFNNVNDYNNLALPAGGITDIAGNPVGASPNYSALITITQQALQGVPAAESLLITVTVTFTTGIISEDVTVQGYRTRYAPNAGS
ncbi:MAG: type II secretion system protein [Betaproteobacteria bacterium]|nr:type II secretion system protein [Betaproteobacteria bacterium]